MQSPFFISVTEHYDRRIPHGEIAHDQRCETRYYDVLFHCLVQEMRRGKYGELNALDLAQLQYRHELGSDDGEKKSYDLSHNYARPNERSTAVVK